MISKTFQARSKLNDIDSLKKYLQKTDLSHQDYYNLIRQAYQKHRDKFIKILQLLKNYQKNIFDIKLKQNTIFIQLCRNSNSQEVQALLKMQNIKVLDKKGQFLSHVLYNNMRKNDRVEALEIVRVVYAHDPKMITANLSKSYLADAFQKGQYQVAQYLIQKGADVNYQSPQRQNLLHILMRNYNKKHDKIIMNIRGLLLEKGVDERKTNINSKRPYQLCPLQIQKRIAEQHKSQTNQRKNKLQQNSRNYKGKSDQGSQFGKSRNQQYRQKTDPSPILKLQKQQIFKAADNVVQKRIKQKQRQLAQIQKLSEKSRQKYKKQKTTKRVFTPQQLKYFLNEDIKYFIQQIQKQNEHQKSFLHELIQKITQKIKQNVGAIVRIFGSFATQLCLAQSDIDMVIIPNENQSSEQSFALLEKISHLLQVMTEQVQNVKFIKTASVPIIKIQCSKKYDSKKIDITYKDQNHNGLNSVQLIQNYLKIYPQLRDLVFVLKKFIYSTNIYDPYSGGLSSYGLILMIVAYLQNQNRQRKSKPNQDPNKLPTIAQLLIGFLHFYGFKSNYIGKQICVIDVDKAKAQMDALQLDRYFQNPIYVYSMDTQVIMYTNDWQPKAKLIIIDPLNSKNNIGRATHKIRQIKAVFEMAYVCLHTFKNCKNKKNCQSYRRIHCLNLRDTKCQNYKRPCCIINRMMNCTKSFNTA